MIECEFIRLGGKVYLNLWAPIMHLGRKVSIGELRQCVNQLKAIERRIPAMKNMFPHVAGWAIWIYHSKQAHKKQIEKLGTKKFTDTDDRTWYIKEIV